MPILHESIGFMSRFTVVNNTLGIMNLVIANALDKTEAVYK